MAEYQKRSPGSYHLYAPASKPFFSYKKPSDGNSYSMMIPQIHNGNITLKFQRRITPENTLDLQCYLPMPRVRELRHVLAGIIGRRQLAYEKGELYDTNESWNFPVCSFFGGTETHIGDLKLDTELIDGIPRIRMIYRQNDVNDEIEIVFNDRSTSSEVKGTGELPKVDIIDGWLFHFFDVIDEIATDPLYMMMYNMIDAAVSNIGKSTFNIVSSLLGKGGSQKGGNSRPTASVPDEYDPF